MADTGTQKSVMAETYPKVTSRPGPVIDVALKAFCRDKDRTESQAVKMALTRFLPRKYLIAARKKLNGRKAVSK